MYTSAFSVVTVQGGRWCSVLPAVNFVLCMCREHISASWYVFASCKHWSEVCRLPSAALSNWLCWIGGTLNFVLMTFAILVQLAALNIFLYCCICRNSTAFSSLSACVCGWCGDKPLGRTEMEKVLPTFLNYCHYSICLLQLENRMFVLLELLKPTDLLP